MAKNVKPRKIKFSKVAIVMFLTVLIWVYADLALDDTHLVPDVPISIAGSGDSELWATFKNEDGAPVSSIAMHIVLKGPASRVAEVKRKLNNGLVKLAFSLNPGRQQMDTSGSHTRDALDFIRKRDQIRGMGGITVESCEPNKITVDVVKLKKKELEIRPVDENGRTLEIESISQSKVSMFVPEDWGQDKWAEVKLTRSEIEQARVKPVPKMPYVVLADNRERRSDTVVTVKLPPEEDKLGQYTISRVVVGYCYSPNTQGYKPEFQKDDTQLSNEIKIRATLEAMEAYKQQLFQIIVEIDDNYRSGEDVSIAPRYNLPEEYVRRNEIKLDPENEPRMAKFKLVPLRSGDGS